MTSQIEQDHRGRSDTLVWATTAVLCTAIVTIGASFVGTQLAPRPTSAPAPGFTMSPYGAQPATAQPPTAFAATQQSLPMGSFGAQAPAPQPNAVQFPQQYPVQGRTQNAPAPATPAQTTQLMQPTSDPAVWTVADAEAGARVYEILRQLPGIDVAGAGAGAPIIAFFDPRCPHCYTAHKQLDGRLNIHWVPVAALGDAAGGNAIIRSILGAQDPAMAMRQVLDNEEARRQGSASGVRPIPPVAQTAERDGQAAVAIEAFAQLASTLQSAGATGLGVPLFVVPRSTGQLGFFIGAAPDLAQRLTSLKAG